ncbi:dihydrodipicolinate synthase family protein [Pseudonocardia sp. MH-G8]|uniref:dihydrodipicolinate synthase family protein n=1 Tax=Pseudonocardia sp. MH-G8 TaxID=1854588 RepID=UPI000B9FA557|nr:dihydrodipicolinate synthase family protein [Pseudonocardia sp. MH-G8]OZM75669.1 dihydrodipicolinate synthase family protein [Pseudonocardia sp. MH-G8]
MSASPTGVLPVLATPFGNDGEIDFPALAGEIEWVLAQQVDGVVVGMVSEVLRLSSEERDLLTERVCSAVAGRATVTASVGAESLHTAARHARHAQASGANAVMAIPPLATACDDAELHRYFAGILDSIDIPLVVQDASGYVGRPLSTELQARLLREYGEDRAVFKPEAHPIGPRLSALRHATGGRARVYEGTGGLALVDSFRRGVVGTMPGPDLCWALVALWRALESGDDAAVDAINPPLSAIVSVQNSLDSFVAVQKHLLHRQGVLPEVRSRGPVGFSLDPETQREVDRRFDLLAGVVEAGMTH